MTGTLTTMKYALLLATILAAGCAGLRHQPPPIDLAGDGGGNQGGAGNRFRSARSSPLHLAQGADLGVFPFPPAIGGAAEQGRCGAGGAAEQVIAWEGDGSCV